MLYRTKENAQNIAFGMNTLLTNYLSFSSINL